MTSSISSGSFYDVRRPTSLRHHLPGQRHPVLCLEPSLGGRDQPVGDGEQPGLATGMPAPVDGDRLQAEIDGGKARATGDACRPQD